MRFGSALAIALLVASPASAATVTSQQGQTLINRGQGFQQVVGSVEVGPGVQVVVNPGGQGQVSYPDGCSLPIAPGTVYTVPAASPCAAGNNTTNAPSINPLAVGAVVLGGAAAVVVFSQTQSASP